MTIEMLWGKTIALNVRSLARICKKNKVIVLAL